MQLDYRARSGPALPGPAHGSERLEALRGNGTLGAAVRELDLAVQAAGPAVRPHAIWESCTSNILLEHISSVHSVRDSTLI